jgi:hypothetical protein
MPTPFTHLACARRLLEGGALPTAERRFLRDHLPAFVLGSIAADGHGGAGLRREDTHFYTYERPIDTPPAQVMLARFPALSAPASGDQRACVAGYIGHLAMDEAWTEGVMRPYFIEAVWGSSAERFLALNLLLIGLDERDRPHLDPALGPALAAAAPRGWLPFLPDDALGAWQAIIARQLAPGAPSETLPIISQRTGVAQAELRALLDTPSELERRVWAHVPPSALREAEARMTELALTQVRAYLDAYAPG